MSAKADNVIEYDFLNEQERLYFAEARLGIEVEKFLKSDVGRYLHGRARQEYEEAKELMLECNPSTLLGRRKIRKLQNKAQTAARFMQWCAEGIANGRGAEVQLEDYRSIS